MVRTYGSFLNAGRTLWRPAVFGAALGLLLFLAEALFALKDNVAGIAMDTQGPFAALWRTVAPAVGALLVRVAVVYVLAGAILGVAAWFLASAVRIRGAWPLEVAVLFVLWAWDRAIARPALFDDLSVLKPVLAALVNGGEPWHPRVGLALWVLAHAVRALQGKRAVELKAPALKWATVFVGLALGWTAVHWDARSSRHPLVILIGVDAFRPDRLDARGGEIAPHIRDFLEDATRFDAAYTPIAQTEPAWRSLLTARWPHKTGVRYPLTAESRWSVDPTFSDVLARSGFKTYFRTDCSRFNHQGPLSGFQDRRQPPRGALNFVLEKLRFRALGLFADNPVGAAWIPELVENRAIAGIHAPWVYAQRLADDLKTAARASPTLFAFHATAAHFPGDPVYPFYRRYVSASEPLDRRIRMKFAPIEPGSKGGGTLESSMALYDELLAQADAQVGVLLQTLKDAGLYEDALIVVFSDHGESFHADRPDLWGTTPLHGARLGEEENRILLGIKLPASFPPQPAVSRDLVRLVDLGPTILDAMNAPALSNVDGVSLMPLLKGQTLQPLKLYAETGFTHARPDVFDAEHIAGAPRRFEAYRIRPDGVVELGEEAHAAVLAEKDVGAFDGQRWIVRTPRTGRVDQQCRGACPDTELARWLDSQLE